MIRVFIPGDAAARSVGADAVARMIAEEAERRRLPVTLVRNGSRGLLWLEPMVEIEIAGRRRAFGPVRVADVAGLFEAGAFERNGGEAAHPLAFGDIEAHPWLVAQTRQSFARVGRIDPLSIADYRAQGGFRGLEAALGRSGEAICAAILASGLRGRGGAGFPAGIKWNTVRGAAAPAKFIVCNADEGDSGTFADRMLMEGDPFALLEGMVIAGLATGAETGFIYLRSEYPDAEKILMRALPLAEAAGLIGPSVMGSGRAFSVEVRRGAGAYICGEETALLESLEGKRGVVRAKPPIPALSGLFGQPTLVHNVLTLAAVPGVLAQSAESYAALGTGKSRGTLAIQLGGNVARGGLLEVPFGMPLRRVIEEFGGGTRSGRPVKAVQVGGPLGAYLPADGLDVPLDYEAFAGAGAMLGHGGIVVFDDTVDMARQARFAFAFCAAESCGKCTPCRIGAVRGREAMDRVLAGEAVEDNLALVTDLSALMTDASLCAMGGLTPQPVMSALRHFPDDFRMRAR